MIIADRENFHFQGSLRQSPERQRGLGVSLDFTAAARALRIDCHDVALSMKRVFNGSNDRLLVPKVFRAARRCPAFPVRCVQSGFVETFAGDAPCMTAYKLRLAVGTHHHVNVIGTHVKGEQLPLAKPWSIFVDSVRERWEGARFSLNEEKRNFLPNLLAFRGIGFKPRRVKLVVFPVHRSRACP